MIAVRVAAIALRAAAQAFTAEEGESGVAWVALELAAVAYVEALAECRRARVASLPVYSCEFCGETNLNTGLPCLAQGVTHGNHKFVAVAASSSSGSSTMKTYSAWVGSSRVIRLRGDPASEDTLKQVLALAIHDAIKAKPPGELDGVEVTIRVEAVR